MEYVTPALLPGIARDPFHVFRVAAAAKPEAEQAFLRLLTVLDAAPSAQMSIAPQLYAHARRCCTAATPAAHEAAVRAAILYLKHQTPEEPAVTPMQAGVLVTIPFSRVRVCFATFERALCPAALPLGVGADARYGAAWFYAPPDTAARPAAAT